MTPDEVARLTNAAAEAFSRGDMDRMLATCHPEIEWVTTGVYLEPGAYRGHEGVRQYLGSLRDELPDMAVDLHVLASEGERGVIYWRAHGRGRASGAPVEIDVFTTVEVRDGLLYRMHNYRTRDEALAAGGVSTA